MSDIVDAIDALVDEQLAAGPVDDYNADRYDKCPHCDRHWHGLPLTHRIATMYTWGQYDETYKSEDDDTPILCRGSDFIGPMPAPPKIGVTFESFYDRIYSGANGGPGFFNSGRRSSPHWIDEAISSTEAWITESLGLIGLPAGQIRGGLLRWWRLQLPMGSALIQQIPENTTTLEIGDNTATWPSEDTYVVRSEPENPASDAEELHVLAEHSPDLGGTWEPMTAPGVATHPSRGLTRVGPNPWDFDYTPAGGQRMTFVRADGRQMTGYVTNVDRPRNSNTYTITLNTLPPADEPA